jgi:uncharacterized membrane protein
VRNAPQVTFITLGLIALGQVFWQHAHLPARVATHFDATGAVNGWMTRDALATLHAGTLLFMAAIFQGLALLQSRLPRNLVNIPHRDFWLSPERAAATHAWVGRIILLLGCGIFVFFIGLFHLLYRANQAPEPRLAAGVWWLTGALLVFVVSTLAVLLKKFGRKPSA